jgi:4-hydroxybenzoate polyprenyltransferase
LGGVLIEGMLVLLSYLIGLSYVAKQENLAVFRNAWPLLFLFAPFVYGTRALIGGWVGALVFLVFLLWVGSAVALLRRGGRGNIPRAVVRLIAGISLLDALLIARGGHSVAALLATLGFCMTLFFQRYIRGT